LAVCLILLIGCQEPSSICFKKSGQVESQIIDLESFRYVTIQDNISLILANGAPQVILTTGNNLVPRIDFSVLNDRLTIQNLNVCNWTRDYAEVTVTITHPNLEEIELLGYGSVKSADTLSVDQLRIISLDSPSDIFMLVKGNRLLISSNNVSNFELSGTLEEMHVGFYNGDGILFARKLQVNTIVVDHRGTNNMHIFPILSLEGSIQGAGNIILHNKPDKLDVKMTGSGKLITKY